MDESCRSQLVRRVIIAQQIMDPLHNPDILVRSDEWIKNPEPGSIWWAVIQKLHPLLYQILLTLLFHLLAL